MNKVLLISYVFPPMAAVGGYRTIKYCKFLPEFGWQPSVLTVRSGYNTAYDHSLLDQIAPTVPVYRSGNWEPLDWWDRRSQPAPKPPAPTPPSPVTSASVTHPSGGISSSVRLKGWLKRMLSLPDRNNFWVPFGVKTGLQAVRDEHIDVLYTTSPPHSTHLVGYYLSLLTGKPLVIDFRDLWTQNEAYHLKGYSPWQLRLDRGLERKVIDRAAAIVTTTPSFTELVRRNNPTFEPAQVYTITNGIDADDFTHVEMPTVRNERFTILHLGSLYGLRNPGFFFEAVTAWAKRRPEITGRVQIDFIGNTPGFESMVQQPPLKGLVNMLAHIPHDKVLNRLWQADLLLLILGFDLGGKGVLPAKLFEYVCTGRPILAMVPSGGEAQSVLDSYNKGLTVSSPDLEKTVAYLNEQFDGWQKSPAQRVSSISIPPQFDRRIQAKALSEVLSTALARRSHRG